MKSGSSGGQRADDEGEDDILEPAHELPRPPGKGEATAGEFDDFDEEDFDDEFDDDFEEELEDEYDLSEFGDPTEDDLAEDEDVDVTALGDFVDEDAEPEEPPVVEGAEEAFGAADDCVLTKLRVLNLNPASLRGLGLFEEAKPHGGALRDFQNRQSCLGSKHALAFEFRDGGKSTIDLRLPATPVTMQHDSIDRPREASAFFSGDPCQIRQHLLFE